MQAEFQDISCIDILCVCEFSEKGIAVSSVGGKWLDQKSGALMNEVSVL